MFYEVLDEGTDWAPVVSKVKSGYDAYVAFKEEDWSSFAWAIVGIVSGKVLGRLAREVFGSVAKGLADPQNIRFTQDSIGTTFRDGRSVQGLIDGLKSGKVSPNNLPPIRTFQKDGMTFTLGNRRLFAADQAGVKIRTVPATAQEIAKELPRKFTTPNQGCIICVRGSLE